MSEPLVDGISIVAIYGMTIMGAMCTNYMYSIVLHHCHSAKYFVVYILSCPEHVFIRSRQAAWVWCVHGTLRSKELRMARPRES